MKTAVIFTVLSLIISIISGIFCLYHFVIALFGLKNIKKPQPLNDKLNRFAAVISARNEENVIARLVESLKRQDYPEELLDIYVIADNCTDKTRERAEQAGATVIIRNDKEHATKGAALNFLFNRLFDDKDFVCDAFLFFDADNIVDSSFVSKMNEAYNSGCKMAQGYRDISNPYDSWVSGAYGVYFLFLMRFCLQARVNAGTSAFLGGTGFMVQAALLKKCGWNTKEISEDIEFSLYRISEGEHIAFVREAVFFDEQPKKFKDSWVQRKRWSTGLYRCIASCTPSLIKGFSKNKLPCLDGFMYLWSVPNVFLGIIALALSIAALFCSGRYFLYSLGAMLFSAALSVIIMHLAAVFVLWLEKKDLHKYKLGILGFPLFLITFMLVTVCAVLFPTKEWQKVRHSGSSTIEK